MTKVEDYVSDKILEDAETMLKAIKAFPGYKEIFAASNQIK